MEATTAPTTSTIRQGEAGLWYCNGCDAFPYFTDTEALACAATHTATELVEGCNAEGQETFGPAVAPATQRPGVKADEVRWTNRGDWVLRGPARIMVAGATVTVTKGNGSTQTKTLGVPVADPQTRWDTEPMAIAQEAGAIERAATRQAVAEVPEGIHLLAGEAFKVVTSQAGRRYAKRLDGTRWVYDAGAVRNLSAATLASREEAAAYGKLTGVCCCCGRTLTNPDSIEAGIGPVCAAKF